MKWLLLLLLCASAPAAAQGWPPQSTWDDLQWNMIVGQEECWDCGPAAAATVLALLGKEEPDKLTPAEPPVHLGHLQDMLADAGLETAGYSLQPRHLEYFGRDEIIPPVILHVLDPGPHFCVLVDAVAGWYLIADPGTGWQWLQKQRLYAIWSGYALLPALADGDLPRERIESVVRPHRQRLQFLQQAADF